LNKGNVYRYDELGMEIILYKILQDEDVKQNYLNKVQILIDYDNKYNLKIFETLKTYVLNQGNMAMAARSLDVHRNTIKYRLNKAEELLDLNLSSTNSFLNLAILLRIYEINNSANGLALN
jgi:DNA-binding PucR family transcriptional regulator